MLTFLVQFWKEQGNMIRNKRYLYSNLLKLFMPLQSNCSALHTHSIQVGYEEDNKVRSSLLTKKRSTHVMHCV